MQWQQIVGFLHVARSGSFTKAAEATFRTQSALSQQIKALEEELGCALFERISKRKLHMTAAGERFAKFAEAVLRHHESLQEELNELKEIQAGPLRIAAPFTTLYHLLPKTLKDYVERFPLVQITVLDRPQHEVIDMVRNGDIDFGLALESIIPEGFIAVRWKRVETMLMTPKGHPLAEMENLTLEHLAEYPLILPPKGQAWSNRAALEQQFQRLRLAYHVILESSNVDLTSVYVEMGLGVAFASIVRDLPSLVARELEFVPLNDYFDHEYVAVVMRKDKTLASYKRAFLDSLVVA
jgi:DNA-binding transcriptional LysR family regulator